MIDLHRTIPEVVINAANKWGDHTAIDDHGAIISYRDLSQRSRDAALAFIKHGLQKGDRFAIWAPNIHEWIWVAIGGLMAGGILVPLNTRYKGIEAGDILNRSKAKMLFTVSGFLDTDYPALLGEHRPRSLQSIVLLRGDNGKDQSLESFLRAAEPSNANLVDQRLAMLKGSDTSDIMYTSGTTGAPKGVMSSHGQVVAIFETWSQAVGLNNKDKYLIVNPFFHTFGYKSGWLASFLTGATALPEPVFDSKQILHTIESKKVSMLPGAPTLFQSLLADASHTCTDMSSLRCAVTGAASVPEQLVRDMKDVLGFNEVYTGYGLTECGVVSICRDGDDFETIANTAGRAIDGIQVKVVDQAGQSIAAGEIGNIKVKGFNVMQGYLDDPAATAETIDQEGWLDTGDIGWQNQDGYIKITDRAKDLFICGGFNCYPAEIENLLLLNPAIADVAVRGVDDERMGEVAWAYVVLASDQRPSEKELIDWSREHMANYKAPRKFIVVDALPRNASGKVQKFLLEH